MSLAVSHGLQEEEESKKQNKTNDFIPRRALAKSGSLQDTLKTI
jgi:hypothetical protein